MPQQEWIEIGRVLKPWGVHGEMKILVTSDVPGRFDGLDHIWLRSSDGHTVPVEIEQIKHLNQALVLKLKGIESPQEAEQYRGWDIAVPEQERAPLEEGVFYIYELIGLDVFDASGNRLGHLGAVYQGAAQDVFEIVTDLGAVLVPAVGAFIRHIDLRGRRIIARLPEQHDAGAGGRKR